MSFIRALWSLRVADKYRSIFCASPASGGSLQRHLLGVMAGLVPAIHVFLAERSQEKTWMPATSAGMTVRR
jgi:hypothetical protein